MSLAKTQESRGGEVNLARNASLFAVDASKVADNIAVCAFQEYPAHIPDTSRGALCY